MAGLQATTATKRGEIEHRPLYVVCVRGERSAALEKTPGAGRQKSSNHCFGVSWFEFHLFAERAEKMQRFSFFRENRGTVRVTCSSYIETSR